MIHKCLIKAARLELTEFLQVPEAILIQTLEKGTESLALRRKAEYHLFTRSEHTCHDVPPLLETPPAITHSPPPQTWEPTPSLPRARPSPSPGPTRRPCCSPTPPCCWSTPPGSSSTPYKSKHPQDIRFFLYYNTIYSGLVNLASSGKQWVTTASTASMSMSLPTG